MGDFLYISRDARFYRREDNLKTFQTFPMCVFGVYPCETPLSKLLNNRSRGGERKEENRAFAQAEDAGPELGQNNAQL